MKSVSTKSVAATKSVKSVTPAAKTAFANPYRVGGGYWASVEALRTLGIGKMHPLDTVIPAVRKAMGEGWKPFAAKAGKLTADERAAVNVMVTARADYGKPLRDATAHEVRWDGRQKVAGLYPINAPQTAAKVIQKPQDATATKAKAKAAPKGKAKPSKGGKGKAK